MKPRFSGRFRALCATFVRSLRGLLPVFLSPFAHPVENGHQRFSAPGEAVFHFRGDLRVFFADDESVGFQLFQRAGKGFVGNAFDISLQFVVAHHAEFRKGVQNGHFVFSADEGEGIAESRIAEPFVCNASACRRLHEITSLTLS